MKFVFLRVLDLRDHTGTVCLLSDLNLSHPMGKNQINFTQRHQAQSLVHLKYLRLERLCHNKKIQRQPELLNKYFLLGRFAYIFV